jgi:broad specificity phosphatase PhoE
VTRLALVRHGESVWQAENRYAGNTDIPLSARGREQLSEIGLRDGHISLLKFNSPLEFNVARRTETDEPDAPL